MSEITGYELSRQWFNFCFDNPERIKPIHSAIYFFAIEHCNRLGWKNKFGFPSQMVMEAIGVKNWRTYSKALNEVVDFGFIDMIETSKNQYSSNIIAIVKNTKAPTKALDKALSNHSTKQGTKHSQSTVSIDKQTNKEQITIKQLTTDWDIHANKSYSQKRVNDLIKNHGYDERFEYLYDLSFSKKEKAPAFKYWLELSIEEKRKVHETWSEYVVIKPDKYQGYFRSFLSSRGWESDFNNLKSENYEKQQQKQIRSEVLKKFRESGI